MKDTLIIDCHAHVFPDKVALKAMGNIYHFYNFQMPEHPVCSLEHMRQSSAAAGVSMSIIHSTALAARNVEHINDWLASLADKDLCPFGTLHIEYESIPKEVDRMISLGLKGVKLHPDMQEFNIDDERAMPIYEACEGRLPILFHVGDSRTDFSHPRRLANVMDRFPNLVCIGAHLAAYSLWDTDAADRLYGRENLYIDTSSAISFISPELAKEIILRHGTDRVLFGTDYPVSTADIQLKRFYEIDLSEEDRRKILGLNAAKLLNLKL